MCKHISNTQYINKLYLVSPPGKSRRFSTQNINQLHLGYRIQTQYINKLYLGYPLRWGAWKAAPRRVLEGPRGQEAARALMQGSVCGSSPIIIIIIIILLLLIIIILISSSVPHHPRLQCPRFPPAYPPLLRPFPILSINVVSIVCIYIYICICMCVYIYIYIYIYISYGKI